MRTRTKTRENGVTLNRSNVNIAGYASIRIESGNESCVFTAKPGFTIPSGELSCSSAGVFGSMTLVNNSSMNSGTTYTIANISCCRPSANRVFARNMAGINWTFTVQPNGDVLVRYTGSSAPLSPNTSTTFYNLSYTR